jgi:hypothetical protein
MERIKCGDCNALVKPSSMERHIITAKHRRAVENKIVRFVDEPIMPFKCEYKSHKVKF